MDYWVIEHPTKGWFVGFDDYGEKPGWRPRFRYSIHASHEDTQKYFGPIPAEQALIKVNKHEKQKCALKQFKIR